MSLLKLDFYSLFHLLPISPPLFCPGPPSPPLFVAAFVCSDSEKAAAMCIGQ